MNLKKGGLWHLLVAIFLLVGSQSMFSQDEPDGFASVSSNIDGLSTTTGGAGGETVIVDNLADLVTYAKSTKKYIIVVVGSIETDGYTGTDSNGWYEIDVESNKTIVGYGNDAALINLELHLISVSNVIIRNLTIKDSYLEGDENGKENDYDAIQCDYCDHIWIDHCLLSHCGDGLIDLRHATNHVTVSWTHLTNHNKAFGIGWSTDDGSDWYVTIHHCWIDSTTQRNPSFDVGKGHLYNNYLTDISSYGNLARGCANVVEQNSYFLRVTNPIKYQDSASMYANNNYFRSCSGGKEGNISTMAIDPEAYYSYELDTTKYVNTIVMTDAGPHAYIGNQYVDSASSTYINISTEGKGSVTPENNYYTAGDYVRLTAIPEDGWEFSGWSDSRLGNTNPVKIVATDSISLTALFTRIGYTVNTSVGEGEGSISFSPDSASYVSGTEVTITATPNNGYIFNYWEGDITGSTNPTTITITDNNMEISAYFTSTTAIVNESINDKISYSYISESKTLKTENNSNDILNLEVYGLDGKKQLSQNFAVQGSIDLSMSELKSGVYIVKLETKEVLKTGKFIVY